MSYINLIKQWLNIIISPNRVENTYAGPRGFYDVVFRSLEHQSGLLAKVLVFFDKRLVDPFVDHHALLKQESPIWVMVDCKHVFLWPFYTRVDESNG